MLLRTADGSRWMGCRVGEWWGTPTGRVACLTTAHLVVAGVLTAGTAVDRSAPVPLAAAATARASDEDIWEGWRAGAGSYVTKPFDVGELVDIVHRLRGTDRAALA